MDLLRSTERSSNRVMEETRVCCMYLCRGPPICPSPPQKKKKSSGANDVISVIFSVLSFECRAILGLSSVEKAYCGQ